MLKRLCALFVLAAFIACGKKEASSIEEFNSLVKKVQKKNEEIGEINTDIMGAVKQYNEKHPGETITLPDSMLGLTKEELKIIQDKVNKEQDLTYKGLLNDIITKNQQIEKMSSDMEELKAKLPKPYLVKSGDSHYKVCMDWLTKEKSLSREQANKLLEEVATIDEMVPGFNIWLYYNEGTFGTFVSQGTATISPNRFKYTMRKQQIDAAKESGRQEVLKSMEKDTSGSMNADTAGVK